MKKKEKRAILILVLVAVVIIAVIWFATKGNKNNVGGSAKQGTTSSQSVAPDAAVTKTQEDGSVENTSNKVKESRDLNGFKVTNILLKKDNQGNTILTADVTNTTSSDQPGFLVDIVLLDKSGKELGTIPGAVVETQAGETIELRAEITEDYVNAYDIKLLKK